MYILDIFMRNIDIFMRNIDIFMRNMQPILIFFTLSLPCNFVARKYKNKMLSKNKIINNYLLLTFIFRKEFYQ